MKEIFVGFTGFNYQELSEKAKEKVKEWYWGWRSEYWDCYDAKFLTEYFAEELKQKGYPHENIGWRLSNSQGDGVAFYGGLSNKNLETLVKRLMVDRCRFAASFSGKGAEFPANFLEYLENVTVVIEKNCCHYDHWNTMTIGWKFHTSDEDDVQFKPVFDDFMKRLKADIIDTSKELEVIGYQEIEYELSEESLINRAQANDWLFDSEGNLIELPE